MDDRRREHQVGTGESSTSGRLVVVGLAAAVAVMIMYFALGMPGMDHGGGVEHDDHGTDTIEQVP